ncbi:ABC transporter ATP-binding protein [Paenibacillus sp. 2TAF8]|uniref:ABC transporter ATP-binding protein n=1 Tax=Paenibacillus sp. 2TAF8 TaxID=3233020 RepID=UPI003F987013
MNISAWKKGRLLLSIVDGRKAFYIVLMIAKSMAEASLYIIVGFVTKYVVDSVIINDTEPLIRTLILTVFCVLASVIVIFCSHFLFNRIVLNAIGSLKLRLYKQLVQKREKSIKEVQSGDMLSRITNDVYVVQRVLSREVYNICFAIVFGISSLISMMILNWFYALVFTGGWILIAILNTRMTRGVEATSRTLQQSMGKMTERLNNLLAGSLIVKLYGMKEFRYKEFSESNKEATEAFLSNNQRYAYLDSTNYLFGWLSNLILILIGCLFFVRGISELGDLMAISQLLFGLNFMLNNLGRFLIELGASIPAIERIVEIDNLPHSEHHKVYERQATEQKNNSHIEFNQVTYCDESGKQILYKKDLKIDKGELIAITGDSGSGKSTILKLLLGLNVDYEGEILLNGRNIYTYSSEDLSQMIAYVPQNSFLFNLTISENIRLGKPDATEGEIIQAAKSASIHEFIMELPLKYESLVNEESTNLSGGQRQRIALARALIKDSPILILDEATSSLDYLTEEKVMKEVMLQKHKRTVIMVSHKPSAHHGFDRIISLSI